MMQNLQPTARVRVTVLVTTIGLTVLIAACGRDEANAGRSDVAVAGESASSAEDLHEGEPSPETPGRVTLTEAARRNAGIETAEVRAETVVGATNVIEAPGRVDFDPSRVALISPRTSGRIERLDVVAGVSVRSGQPVAYLLSTAFLTAQNDFIQAARRTERLARTPDEEGARALEAAARRRLQMLGVSDTVLTQLARDGRPVDWLPVVAPFDGSIIERHAMVGAAVEPGSPLYTIADLSHVDVLASVPERALEALHLGQTATVRIAAYPTLQLQGRVERIGEVLDTATRTVEAAIRVANLGHRLRPGMFASVSLRSTRDAIAVPVLVVPASAVVVDGSDRFVFVEVAERTYERRMVDATPLPAAGERAAARSAIREGVSPGERVVIRGAFFLKSELAKAAFGEHHD